MRSEVLYRALKRVSSKRLIKGRLVSPEGEFCSLGACLTPKERKAYLADPTCRYQLVKLIRSRISIPADNVWPENDKDIPDETGEKRYQRMLAWAEEDV